jgi:hypothetical protein
MNRPRVLLDRRRVRALPAVVAFVLAALATNVAATTITLKPGAVPQGGKTKVVGSGFVPADVVTIAIDGTAIGTAVATATGAVAKTVKVPLVTTVGGHTISVSGALGGTAAAPVDVTPGYRLTVLGEAPVAYFRLADRGPVMLDASGFARHGLYSTAGNVRFRVGGALLTDPDKAAYSTGGPNAVSGLAAAGFLPGGNASRTIEAWYKSTDTRQHAVVGYGTTGRGRAFGLAVWTSHVWLDTYYGYIQFNTTRNIKDGKWHHLVVTWDGANGACYLDGTPLPIVSDSIVRPLVTVSSNLLVGGWVDELNNKRLVGRIDEVAIYDWVLTPAHVLAHLHAAGRK